MVGCTLKPWGKIKLPHWVPFVRYCVAEYEKVNTGRMMKDLREWGRAHVASKTLHERDRCHQKPSISNSQSRGKTTPDKSILAGRAQQERDPHHFNFFLCVISLKICKSADQRTPWNNVPWCAVLTTFYIDLYLLCWLLKLNKTFSCGLKFEL